MSPDSVELVPSDETPSQAAPPAVLTKIRECWGFDSLRPLQWQAIQAGLEHRDSLVVLPTGGGKSLCYQVPPLVAARMDVVVSPLIALMRDQVEGLLQNGYPAAALHSHLSPAEQEVVVRGVEAGEYRLLFVAPERLVQPEFLDFLAAQRVRSLAIDEAHCISQWGHDFRPEYRQLAMLRERFPEASVHAFTATATERVRRDIVERLALSEPEILVGQFDRPNLTYRVQPAVDVRRQTLEIVRRHAKEAVIVYCLSRKDTERTATFLRKHGVQAAAYHAGLEGAERSRIQDAFAAEELDVVCATVAFGMGIDRSDVRCVVHAAMPKSVEHYQQESGRAGRDGLEAECVLLYSAADGLRWERLIERSAHDSEDPATTVARGRSLLQGIRSYCTVARCRHQRLSEYFGQPLASDCGGCDVCLGEVQTLPDSTVVAQKILSCVYRMGERWGVQAVADVLRGATSEAVRQRHHDQLSTYGILADQPSGVLVQLIYQLVDLGHLARSSGEYPVLRLGETARAVLRGEQEVQLIQPVIKVRRAKRATESWEGVDPSLFEALRGLRRRLAAERKVPAYLIFNDSVLRTMAARQPESLESLHQISGVGEKKLADFGQAFLDVILAHSRDPLTVG